MALFVGKGEVYLRDPTTKKEVKQVLWGDWLNVLDSDDKWHRVKWGAKEYAIRKEDCVEEGPLEVVFLDVGQGDGSIITTPGKSGQRQTIVVDAGNRATRCNERDAQMLWPGFGAVSRS